MTLVMIWGKQNRKSKPMNLGYVLASTVNEIKMVIRDR